MTKKYATTTNNTNASDCYNTTNSTNASDCYNTTNNTNATDCHNTVDSSAMDCNGGCGCKGKKK